MHWGGAKTKGLFFVLARRCRPLADMSPARVGFNAPSSKNSRLIFAQQPRPNGKRNPLHHVLRTAGTGRAFEGGALRGGGGGARFDGKRGKGFRVRGSGRASKGWQGGVAGGVAGGVGGEEQPHGRTRTNTDKHGRFLEVRIQVREGPEVVFPWYGKVFGGFSMLWKKVFHGMENLGRYGARGGGFFPWCGKNVFHGVENLGRDGARGADFFHGVEKMFPQCGKVLWGDGAAGGGRWGAAGGAGEGAPVEEGEAGEE